MLIKRFARGVAYIHVRSNSRYFRTAIISRAYIDISKRERIHYGIYASSWIGEFFIKFDLNFSIEDYCPGDINNVKP